MLSDTGAMAAGFDKGAGGGVEVVSAYFGAPEARPVPLPGPRQSETTHRPAPDRLRPGEIPDRMDHRRPPKRQVVVHRRVPPSSKANSPAPPRRPASSRARSSSPSAPQALADVVLRASEGRLSATLEGTVRCVQNRARFGVRASPACGGSGWTAATGAVARCAERPLVLPDGPVDAAACPAGRSARDGKVVMEEASGGAERRRWGRATLEDGDWLIPLPPSGRSGVTGSTEVLGGASERHVFPPAPRLSGRQDDPVHPRN